MARNSNRNSRFFAEPPIELPRISESPRSQFAQSKPSPRAGNPYRSSKLFTDEHELPHIPSSTTTVPDGWKSNFRRIRRGLFSDEQTLGSLTGSSNSSEATVVAHHTAVPEFFISGDQEDILLDRGRRNSKNVKWRSSNGTIDSVKDNNSRSSYTPWWRGSFGQGGSFSRGIDKLAPVKGSSKAVPVQPRFVDATANQPSRASFRRNHAQPRIIDTPPKKTKRRSFVMGLPRRLSAIQTSEVACEARAATEWEVPLIVGEDRVVRPVYIPTHAAKDFASMPRGYKTRPSTYRPSDVRDCEAREHEENVAAQAEQRSVSPSPPTDFERFIEEARIADARRKARCVPMPSKIETFPEAEIVLQNITPNGRDSRRPRSSSRNRVLDYWKPKDMPANGGDDRKSVREGISETFGKMEAGLSRARSRSRASLSRARSRSRGRIQSLSHSRKSRQESPVHVNDRDYVDAKEKDKPWKSPRRRQMPPSIGLVKYNQAVDECEMVHDIPSLPQMF